MSLHHPKLGSVIKYLRPNLKPWEYEVVDKGDGNGPTLVDGSMANPPTQQEVDAVDDAMLADGSKDRETKNIHVTVNRALFWCVNEIRALNNEAPLNAAQFKTFLKGLPEP